MSSITADFNYVEEDKVDPDYKCLICASPFLMPVTHMKCGNTFCKACILKVDKCPTCRSASNAFDYIDSAVIIRKFVNSLKVYCPRCNNIFERNSLHQHLTKCPIKCLLGCGMSIEPNNRETHEKNECANFIVECGAQYCQWQGRRGDYNNKHRFECAFIVQSGLIAFVKQKIEQEYKEVIDKHLKVLQESYAQTNKLFLENQELKKQMLVMQTTITKLQAPVIISAKGVKYFLTSNCSFDFGNPPVVDYTKKDYIRTRDYDPLEKSKFTCQCSSHWIQATFAQVVRVSTVKIGYVAGHLGHCMPYDTNLNDCVLQFAKDINLNWEDAVVIKNAIKFALNPITLSNPIEAQFWRIYRKHDPTRGCNGIGFTNLIFE